MPVPARKYSACLAYLPSHQIEQLRPRMFNRLSAHTYRARLFGEIYILNWLITNKEPQVSASRRALFSILPIPLTAKPRSVIEAREGQTMNQHVLPPPEVQQPGKRRCCQDMGLLCLLLTHPQLCSELKNKLANGRQPLHIHKSSCQGRRKAQHGFSSVFENYSMEGSSQSQTGSWASSYKRPTLTSKQASSESIKTEICSRGFFLIPNDPLFPPGRTSSIHLHMLHVLSYLAFFGEREVKRLHSERPAWGRQVHICDKDHFKVFFQ